MTFQSARDRSGPLILDCDVVIVGSGAGGAVIAAELAEAGLDVVVLEEGPRVTAEEHGAMRASESLRYVWRDGGVSVAFGFGGPAVNVMMGRAVGGSSMLTGGVCFRIPEIVLNEWTNGLRLPGFTAKEMEPYFERVEAAMHVEEVPTHMRSRSTTLFAEGSAKLGAPLQAMRRNTRGCRGCGRCNFGCPEQAKMSVDLSYLPRAVERGARVVSHCLVNRVEVRGRTAIGVSGRVLNGAHGAPGDSLTVRARRVVLSAGAWHGPLVLRASGLRSPALGRHLTLHPGFRMIARFDEVVNGNQGALQSAFTDAYEHEGITLTSLFIPPGVLAATMPGVGRSHAARTAQIPHLAVFGGIVHDEGRGVVRSGPGREPLVTYRMTKRDRSRASRLIRVLGDTFLAAGARELFIPVLGMPGLSADAFAALDLDRVAGHRLECSSQHPLGTCRMGVEERSSIVDPWGKAWAIDELYVADGSVLPTSLGVNPQLGIMAVATRIAERLKDTPLR